MTGAAGRTADTPFVVFGDDWGRFVSTIQHVFQWIVPQYPVIWVNSFGHRTPRLSLYDLRRAVEKAGAMVRPPAHHEPRNGGLTLPRSIVQPRALPWHHVGAVHAVNTWSIVRDVRRTLAEVAPRQRPILVSATPIAEGVIGQLNELASIYFCMDDYAALPYVSPHIIEELEPRMLDRVDTVVATAKALVEAKRPRSGNAYQLPQGVNFEHFAQPRSVPPELANLPRPIVGFSGTLSECCDLNLIQRLADTFPQASFVFVGMHTIDPTPIKRPNVHLLGARPYADLPPYVQAFDVGIIPYVLNDWTRAVDSLKLLEYLAAGLPVVTTAFPETRKYAQVVSVTETDEAFISAVQTATQERGGRAGHQEFASHHSWKDRAQTFLEIVDATVRCRLCPTSAAQVLR